MATPTVTVPAADLASTYDIHDPVYEYPVVEPKPAAPATPAAQPAAAATPVQPVPGVPVAPAAQPAPSNQKHPDWLLRKATDLGLHPIIIERLDPTELTQLVMTEQDRLLADHRQSQVTAAVTSRPAPNQPNSPQGATPSASPAAPAWDWGIFDDVDDMGRTVKRQFTDEDISPPLVKAIKDQAAKIAALENQLASIQQHAAAAGQSQVDRQFDSAFNELGGVFGTGTAASLQGKPELEKRVLIYNAVKAMFSSLPPAQREQMGIKKAVHTFAKSMFGVDAPAAAAGGNGQPTAEQFRNGAVAQPTLRRNSDNPLGREKAIEEAQKWWKENEASGSIPQNGGTSMEEFFPMQ